MNTSHSGNVPHTIDNKGNVVPKPFGVSRWATPRRYDCDHKECAIEASILSPGCPGIGRAHNCCYMHKAD